MITISLSDKKPIYEQIIDNIISLVSDGYYKAGDQLPSVRQLALELSINPNTIQRAYSELEQLGVIVSIKSRGSFISDNIETAKKCAVKKLLSEFTEAVHKLFNMGVAPEELTQILNSLKNGGLTK